MTIIQLSWARARTVISAQTLKANEVARHKGGGGRMESSI